MTKVSQSLDLELESKTPVDELSVDDKEPYSFDGQLTVNLAKDANDSKQHYAVFSLSITLNKTASDYEKKKEMIPSYDAFIREKVTEAFSKCTYSSFTSDSSVKEKMRQDIADQLNELLDTKCVVDVSFGNIVLQ